MQNHFIIILIVLLIKLITSNNNTIEETIIKSNNSNKIEYNYIKKESQEIGKINIHKLNINNNLYEIESPYNNINQNITILKGTTFPNDNNNSLIILAAHSGYGNTAYFKDLNKLNKNDEINITIKNKHQTYIVKDIWEEDKKGTISFKKENKPQLILTTCSPTNEKKQLIINCIIKED